MTRKLISVVVKSSFRNVPLANIKDPRCKGAKVVIFGSADYLDNFTKCHQYLQTVLTNMTILKAGGGGGWNGRHVIKSTGKGGLRPYTAPGSATLMTSSKDCLMIKRTSLTIFGDSRLPRSIARLQPQRSGLWKRLKRRTHPVLKPGTNLSQTFTTSRSRSETGMRL